MNTLTSFTYISKLDNTSDFKIVRIENRTICALQLIHKPTKKVVDFISLKDYIRNMHPGWFDHNVIMVEFEGTDYPIATYKAMKHLYETDSAYKPVPIVEFIIRHNDKIINEANSVASRNVETFSKLNLN